MLTSLIAQFHSPPLESAFVFDCIPIEISSVGAAVAVAGAVILVLVIADVLGFQFIRRFIRRLMGGV